MPILPSSSAPEQPSAPHAPLEDVDRRRASALIVQDGTKRLLTPDEVKLIHQAVLSADVRNPRGEMIALAMLAKARNGRVLSYEEADAVAQAIEARARHQPLMDGVQSGVRDPSVTCHRCACAGGSCPECQACPFNISGVGGAHVRNSLSSPSSYRQSEPLPSDCGCEK
jgi:hypothetical protein